MPDIWYDVDVALAEVPVNIMPLIDDTDFKSIEGAVAYNAGGMALRWHFCTTAGAYTVTSVTPTTGGDYDWTDQGDSGVYTIEIPASGGASINNDTEGFGWFTGVATGVLPWRGPTLGFRAAEMNNSLIDAASKGVLAPATAARTLVVDANGLADANMVKAGPTGSGTAITARDIGASVLLSSGTGTGQLDFTSGVVKSNLAQILGTALTETAGQIAAAFKKFFDKATPTGTINSLPDAVAGASGGLLISGSNSGTTTLGALTVTGATTLTGAVSLGSTLGVTGTATFAAVTTTGTVTFNALTVSNATTLTGAVSLGSTLDVTGTTTFAALTTTGTVTMNALTVSNATTLTGAVSLGSTLGVTGTATFAAVTTTGTVTMNALTVSNATTLTGAVSLGSTLGVTGTTTFAAINTGTITTTGNWAVSGTVTLTGAVTATNAANDLRINGAAAGASGGVALVGSAMTLASSAVQAVWDAATSVLTTFGSIGKLLVDRIDAAITSRMATYTQPTGFLAATFPGTVASTTNITAASGVALTSAYDFAKGTVAMTYSFRANGAEATPIQAAYEILLNITEQNNSGTTRTVNGLDHTTPVATYTYDSAAPNTVTRTT